MSPRVRDYRELRVWQRSVDLVEAVYLLSRELPADERFGLTSQMRRASVSVATNIAEGNGRTHLREYLHHLSFAHGSIRELETLATIVYGHASRGSFEDGSLAALVIILVGLWPVMRLTRSAEMRRRPSPSLPLP